MIVFVMIAMLIVTCSISNIKAITDGETVSYTAKKGYHNDDGIYIQAKFTVGNYTGVCCESGNELSTSGNAKATKLSNNSKTAKIAYYYGIVKGWQNNGKSDWKQAQIDMGDNGAQPSLREAIFSIYDETNWNAINVPSNFEIFKANPTDGSQDFAVWRYAPFEASKTYASGSKGAGGAKVRVGEEIAYQIAWTGGSGSVTITDTISTGLQFSSVPSGCSTSGQTMTCTSTSENGTITYKAKVGLAAAGTSVCNNATAKSGSETKTLAKLCNPVPEFKASKSYASGSKGAGGAAVKKGDEITYQISWSEGNGNVVIKDTLSAGLEFVSASPAPTSTSGQTITWSGLTAASGTITYKVKTTNAAAGNIVCNSAKATAGLESKTLATLCNFVPAKDYASDSPNGKGNIEVKKGNTIKYNIKYGNTTSSSASVTITDVLSKGLSYVSGSSNLGEPSVTNNSDGTSTLVWNRTLASGVSESLIYSAKATGSATMVENGASIKYGNNPVIDLDVIKNSVPTKDYASDTPNGKGNIEVKKGNTIKYNIKYGNTTSSSASVTITDVLSKGLKYVSGSSNYPIDSITKNADGTTTIVWTRTLAPGASESLTYSAKTTGEATMVQNGANIKYDNRASIDLDVLKNTVPTKDYASDTPKGKDRVEVRENDEIKYSIKYGNTTSGTQSVRIVDILSAGLTYVENSAKIGNSSAEPIVTKDEGTGETILVWTKILNSGISEELTYSAKINGALTLVQNKADIKYNDRPNIDLDVLKNPVPTKVYSPESPSGLNGYLVKKGDVIKYRIKYANAYDTEENVTIIDTISKGLQYIEGTAMVGDSSLLPEITNNSDGTTTMTWNKKVAPGVVEELEYDVKVTGETVKVKNNARIKYRDRGEFDLNELKNPVPSKDYSNDTPSGLAGFAVKKDDIIKYKIEYSNVFAETKNATITDVLSKGLEYVKGSAKLGDTPFEPKVEKNSKTGITTLVWTKEVEGNAEEQITYLVKVEGITVKVNNNAVMRYDNGLDIKLGELKNPIPKKEYASDTKYGKNGAAVKKGNTITYSIKYANTYDSDESIIITDVLSKGMKYVKRSAKLGKESFEPAVLPSDDGTTMLIWVKTLESGEEKEIKYDVEVTGEKVVIENKASIKYGGRNEVYLDVLKNPVPKKEYSPYTPSGKDGQAVVKTNRIRYQIKYANVHKNDHEEVITDTISKGLVYVKNSSRIGKEKVEPTVTKKSNGTTTLVWKRKVKASTEEKLSYDVMVTGETLKVKNSAKITYEDGLEMELQKLRNPVPQKTYAKDTPAGLNGKAVKEDNIITYSIKYTSISKNKKNVIIMDTISKGLEYQKGTSKINGKGVEPESIANTANGTNLIWMVEAVPEEDYELQYSARVTGEKEIVENNADIQYENEPILHLDELRNPLNVNNKEVKVPDTGTQLAIAGLIFGTALITGGGYVLYRRYKNA